MRSLSHKICVSKNTSKRRSKCQHKCRFNDIVNILNADEKSILGRYKKLYMDLMKCYELPSVYAYKCISTQYDKIFFYNAEIERIFLKISRYESISEHIICILKECLNLQSNPFKLYLTALKKIILSKNLSGLQSFLKYYKKVLLDQFAIQFPNVVGIEPTINNLDVILEQHNYATNRLYYMYRVKLQRMIQTLYFHTKLLPMFIYKIAAVLETIIHPSSDI